MAWFDRIINKRKIQHSNYFKDLGTDLHSHLIPGIDDGSNTIEDSIALIKKMNELGFSRMITTPHVSHEYFRNDRETILSGLDVLRKGLSDERINVSIDVGAEYLLDDGFSNLIKKQEIISFGDNYVLVELPFFAPHPAWEDYIFELQAAGYKVILAHPERYMYWHNNFGLYETLKSREIFFQMNLLALSGNYPPSVRKVAQIMIDKEMYEFAGSDLHNEIYLNHLYDSIGDKYLNKLLSSGKLLNKSL